MIESRRISRLGGGRFRRAGRRVAVCRRPPDRAILTLHARPHPSRAPARRHAALCRHRRGQHAGASDRPVARIRAPPAHHERGPGGAARGHRGRRRRASTRSPKRAGGWSGRPRTWRRSGRADPRRRETGGESLSFEQAKRAEAVAQNQQELIRRAEELKQSLEALRKSAEAAGVERLGVAAAAVGDPRISSIARSRPSCASGSPRCSRRSRTSMPSGPRTPWSAWRRRSGSCARRWSGAASCSSAPRSRVIWPT